MSAMISGRSVRGEPKKIGQGCVGEVVRGGAETAGEDEQASPIAGDRHGSLKPQGIIAHHRLVIVGNAELGQFLG